MATDPRAVLDEVLARTAYERKQKEAIKQAEVKDEDKERDDVSAIDWHAFVPLDTIEFLPEGVCTL